MTALMAGVQAPHLLDTLAGVERVLGLAVGVACGGCGSSVERGRCTYVGCRVLNKFEYTVRYVTPQHSFRYLSLSQRNTRDWTSDQGDG